MPASSFSLAADRAGRDSAVRPGRPALDPAAAPPRHRRGRAAGGGGQCADRRRRGGLLSVAVAGRARRLPGRRPADLLSAANIFWAMGPASLALNLFDGGRGAPRSRIARAQFDEAAANYRRRCCPPSRTSRTISRSPRSGPGEAQDRRTRRRGGPRRSDLSLIRYRDGASDYLEVVTAQTAALDAQRALLDLQTRGLTNAVDSVRALGGVAS